MRFHQVLLGAAVFLAACSSPQKYTYYFDHYDYQSGKKGSEIASQLNVEHSPLVIKEEMITANASNQTVVAEPNKISARDKKEVEPSEAQAIVEKYKGMSKSERKTFRRTLKKELLNYSKKPVKSEGVESIKATKAFDTLAALAIVFGGAGIVMIMLAGVSNVFWVLGAISLVIGAFFFVRWVANGNG